jgi:multidrug efflux system membrane fusion protein
LDNQIDTTTGTLKLKAIFTNDDGALFPNQFVNARLLVDTHHDVTLLPNTAIQRNAQGPFVYLLKTDQTVAMHPVNVKTTDGNVSEIVGLEADATVAGDNFNRLTDGAKVAVRPARNTTSQVVERTRKQAQTRDSQ